MRGGRKTGVGERERVVNDVLPVLLDVPVLLEALVGQGDQLVPASQAVQFCLGDPRLHLSQENLRYPGGGGKEERGRGGRREKRKGRKEKRKGRKEKRREKREGEGKRGGKGGKRRKGRVESSYIPPIHSVHVQT